MNAFVLLAATWIAQPAEPVRFQTSKEGVSVVAQMLANEAAKLPVGRMTQEQGESVLRVSLLDDDSKKPGPAILGKYERDGNDLTFTPRFDFIGGQTYRATLLRDGKPVSINYVMPAPAAKGPLKVLKVYPTTDVLPANHLKFYIYFDRPIRGGKELFKLIQLVDDKGNVIDEPWLIDEFWDDANNCLIIYIHPGRIKWGVELRQQLGPVLFEKRNYAFRIKGELSDPDGNKIGKDYVKKFRTTPENRVRIDVSQWKLEAPKAGGREPLTFNFPKSLDHRSLQRFISVTDEKGKAIDGTMSIGPEEKRWQFVPAQPWQARTYRLDVEDVLEDVAGNTPKLPFDHDLKSPKLPPQNLRWQFQPR
jgi:hypothetical protein